MSKQLSRISAVLLMSCFSGALMAHPGGQDANGGHTQRSNGQYHCHHVDCVPSDSVTAPSMPLSVVSFNIQFLGHFKRRDHEALAAFVAPHDVVVIQELVAPPLAGTFPNGKAYKVDPEAKAFFDAMQAQGFDYVLSREDTGSGDKIHVNDSSTEWWIAFYKPERVDVANDLPSGFLAKDRSNHIDYERVPYAFAFRTLEGGNDFVLISVHLQPGDSKAERQRRQHELNAIANWVNKNDRLEKDFFILGDMNFKHCAELMAILPSGYRAFNRGEHCIPTNTHVTRQRPYSNVLYRDTGDYEIDTQARLEKLDLINAMRKPWQKDFGSAYPGEAPYQHNAFRTRYSDHHPVRFHIQIQNDDD